MYFGNVNNNVEGGSCANIDYCENVRTIVSQSFTKDYTTMDNWGTRAMRRRQFYSANGFVSGNRTTSNFFSKGRYPHNVALTTYFRLMVSSPKTRQKNLFTSHIHFLTFSIKPISFSLSKIAKLQRSSNVGINWFAFGCSAPDSIGSLTGLDGYALIQDVCRKVFVDSLLEVGLEVFDIYAPA
ncbi:hypothetical protein LXL04_039650 [Taraxacum kok-saghyz]